MLEQINSSTAPTTENDKAPTQLEGIRQKVFMDRYSLKDPDGNALEFYPEQLWQRVARGIAEVEKTEEKRAEWEKLFYEALTDFQFVPGGRILAGAGTGHQVTYYNCFVIPPPEDSRQGILDNLKVMTEIMARGGGVGINLSTLRPRGSYIKTVNGTASGPCSWAQLYSVATGDVIQQGGCFGPDERIATDRGLIPVAETWLIVWTRVKKFRHRRTKVSDHSHTSSVMERKIFMRSKPAVVTACASQWTIKWAYCAMVRLLPFRYASSKKATKYCS